MYTYVLGLPIRIKFIEGCLRNLEMNRSAVISLKLLPKLLQSFQNFPGSDTHEMTMYIEKTHNMTQLFFDNLQVREVLASVVDSFPDPAEYRKTITM